MAGGLTNPRERRPPAPSTPAGRLTGTAPAPAQPQLVSGAPAGRQPTPQEREEANRQIQAAPVTARWDSASGAYVYTPMGRDEEQRWRETQQRIVPMPAAPAAPVDPNVPPPPAASTQANFDAARARVQRPTAPATPALTTTPRPGMTSAQPNAARPTVQQPTGAPGQPAAAPAWQPLATDTTRYDAQAARLQELQGTFLSQLERLSGSDPFGNQAALQKSTDRAVAQAAGTAAGARGGAAALAGAQRQAVGVQAQTSARGAQDIIEQRRRDDQQAAGLGLQAISGAAEIGKQLSANEIALGDQAIKTAEVNLRGYLGGQELGQRERESLRSFATEAAKIDMQRYQTDMQYRQSVDADLTQRYIAGTQLEGVYAKISADEGIGAADWLMGTVGLVTGLAGAAATAAPKSDERTKTARVKPSTKTLREFVEKSGDGEFYEYRRPFSDGARPGKNFGPMAQHLARTEIGRTLVAPDRDGTLRVDTTRLALADHSALTHLAGRLARLERKAAAKKGPRK